MTEPKTSAPGDSARLNGRFTRRRNVLVALLALVVVLASAHYLISRSSDCGSEPTSVAQAKPGTPAPAILGTTTDGKPFDLAVYEGRPVIVTFWASWCQPCQADIPILESTLAAGRAQDLAVVSVVWEDAPTAAAAYAVAHGATWPDVVDPCGSIAKAYQAVAPPQTYFIDRAGVLRSRQIGILTTTDLSRQVAAIL